MIIIIISVGYYIYLFAHGYAKGALQSASTFLATTTTMSTFRSDIIFFLILEKPYGIPFLIDVVPRLYYVTHIGVPLKREVEMA